MSEIWLLYVQKRKKHLSLKKIENEMSLKRQVTKKCSLHEIILEISEIFTLWLKIIVGHKINFMSNIKMSQI